MQIDEDVAYRYAAERWLLLKGVPSGGSSLESTYAFFKEVIGYDLRGFFERSSGKLRREIDVVLRRLLSAV
jgi:hypothetical protein